MGGGGGAAPPWLPGRGAAEAGATAPVVFAVEAAAAAGCSCCVRCWSGRRPRGCQPRRRHPTMAHAPAAAAAQPCCTGLLAMLRRAVPVSCAAWLGLQEEHREELKSLRAKETEEEGDR